jgi:hypothetical protein
MGMFAFGFAARGAFGRRSYVAAAVGDQHFTCKQTGDNGGDWSFWIHANILPRVIAILDLA